MKAFAVVKRCSFVALVSLAQVFSYVWASSDDVVRMDSKQQQEAQVVSSSLRKAHPSLAPTRVVPAPIPGLYEVTMASGETLFATPDGAYFIAGEVYKITDKGISNLSEERKKDERVQALASLDKADMIIYSPKGEVKANVTIFTDVDCGYCRLVHKEVPKLNEMGVEVRYLAFPRAGLGSSSYQKIATAWCSDNRQNALNELKAGKTLAINVCKGNPVDKQYILGQRLGVNGTPAIILDDGTLIPGYLKADDLLKRLL